VLGELSPYFDDAKALLSMKDTKGRQDVFVNVPYDSGHGNVVDAIVFATLQCGFLPRLAILGINSSAARLERITALLLKCPLSIHDLTVRRSQHGNARLNMAFELGVAIGCARAMRRQKPVLILDRRPYEVQRTISDINGLEVCAHDGKPTRAIKAVRTFLQSHAPDVWVPSERTIANDFRLFLALLRRINAAPTHSDRVFLMSAWLLANRDRPPSTRKRA
jgi:hypothetical protein